MHSARINRFILPLLAVLVCSISGVLQGALFAEDNQAVESLRTEIAQLRSENDALRRENQILRQLLLEKTASSEQPQAAVPAPVQQSPQPSVSSSATTSQEQTYWLTISSGVRHNSRCRYYHNSNGRPCGPNEGRACKICGG